MREITVTEGLVELKTLGSRIEKAMDTKFVAVNKNPAKGSDDEKQFIKTAKEKYQSVTGLIKERQKVKSAIVESNAITKVVIAGAAYIIGAWELVTVEDIVRIVRK